MKQKLRHETPLTNRAQEMKNQASEGPSQAQETQKGRSMVEMLGVLAIIGVLSIGGIAGYTQAMNRYKANEIADTISKLCVISESRCTSKSWWADSEATLSDLDIQGPIAGCATDITARTSYSHRCIPIVEGCADETGMVKALESLFGGKLTHDRANGYIYFSHLDD